MSTLPSEALLSLSALVDAKIKDTAGDDAQRFALFVVLSPVFDPKVNRDIFARGVVALTRSKQVGLKHVEHVCWSFAVRQSAVNEPFVVVLGDGFYTLTRESADRVYNERLANLAQSYKIVWSRGRTAEVV